LFFHNMAAVGLPAFIESISIVLFILFLIKYLFYVLWHTGSKEWRSGFRTEELGNPNGKHVSF
jgi:hypothetical protein